MSRIITLLLAMAVAVTGWQAWQIHTAREQVKTQGLELARVRAALAASSDQLQQLTRRYEDNQNALAQLNAATEKMAAMMRERQRHIEVLKRENDDLRRWADTQLPDDVIRLHDRPALTGGHAYRDWLSQNNTLQPARRSAENQR